MNMKMDTSRAKRYKDKINIIIKRCGQIEEWQQELDLPKASENEKTKLAIYKAFQEVVEASMDVVAMNTLLPGMQSFVEDVEQWMWKKLKEG